MTQSTYDAATYARLRQDAEAIVARYPVARSALLPMLHLVQSEDSYVSPRGIALCADVLGLTRAEVSAVATFYSQYKRHPNGTYTVGVCTNTLCAVMGGDEIFARLADELGIGHDETTEDGAITLERVECNAACDYAPVVMVNWEFFDNQTPTTAIDTVRRLRAGEDVAPTRGAAKVCTFREVSRVLAGFADGRADEGVGAGPATLEGLAIARERGWTAPPVKPLPRAAAPAKRAAAPAPAAAASAPAPAATAPATGSTAPAPARRTPARTTKAAVPAAPPAPEAVAEATPAPEAVAEAPAETPAAPATAPKRPSRTRTATGAGTRAGAAGRTAATPAAPEPAAPAAATTPEAATAPEAATPQPAAPAARAPRTRTRTSRATSSATQPTLPELAPETPAPAPDPTAPDATAPEATAPDASAPGATRAEAAPATPRRRPAGSGANPRTRASAAAAAQAGAEGVGEPQSSAERPPTTPADRGTRAPRPRRTPPTAKEGE